MNFNGKFQLCVCILLLMFLLFGCNAKKESNLFSEKYRPQYHFSFPEGWMNDPTGMIYYEGLYHLNFRNASSADLIHWDFSLKEKKRNGSIQMMSGASVVDWENTSGFGTNGEPPIVSVYSELRKGDFVQQQSIGYSNDEGFTFTPYKQNPVIDINSTEFRDPMVFWHESSQKWVMAVALAGECRVRFYGSDNLKEWRFLSDFGPYGAREGVWECPDLFPLAVDGDVNNIKWVLEVDVQPFSGQYFIGDFDGEKFTIDPNFEKRLAYNDFKPEGEVLFDFESDLDSWDIEGEAFKESPAKKELFMQCAILGKEGDQFINSFHKKDASKGKLSSPKFQIKEDFINFLIGGGNHPDKECVNLIVENEIVRSATGYNTEALIWKGWDVGDLKGKIANIQIVDDYEGGFGHIIVDHIIQSKTLATSDREKAMWIDYGPDFYAVRSWVNMPENDNRRVWLAWMSNWLYASDVPTKPWLGCQSFPRTVELKTLKEGVCLVQNPIKEIEMLRENHFHLENVSINKDDDLSVFMPEKNTYELIAEFELSEKSEIGFKIAKGNDEETIVGYNSETAELYIDRRKSGEHEFSTSFAKIYRGPLQMNDQKIKLHILVDQSTIEVFGNDGETVISCLIFPDPNSRKIELFSNKDSSNLLSLDMWELKSVWN
ncbi:glycoside hydrolase family 32 protein [Labilibaculum sp. DW002]|uniref:Glycoside hydrolase family 32 protein n=1 Tax=Paralabilibaculum antarcticum TaxID=2912572 RepID=A0ABT5VS36_9BACT|nr:glycoside hydrolase family 32 protein [Labilibaculum sp. DW002]MDE5418097.1 glycoside hydrolase family 32 protein [Labilibaculum sp. DW002]